MDPLFRFPEAVNRSPAIEEWARMQPRELGSVAMRWFGVMRDCGKDVREVLHDGHPTACVTDAAFAYVDTYRTHVNVGFFFGADLPDPKRLLAGSGKRMRHVKVHLGKTVDDAALSKLITAAYADMQRRLAAQTKT